MGKQCAGKGIYEEKVAGGNITWLLGDFFGDGFLKDVDGDDGTFDLIYDYTVRLSSNLMPVLIAHTDQE